MRQIVIDELSREEQQNIDNYLKRTLATGPMQGMYWLAVPDNLLEKEQLEHKECGPFYFAIELGDEKVSFELLIRSQSTLHCSCIAYATETQRNFLIDYIDSLLAEEKIRA